jgi:hypothetical protein
MKCSSSQEFTDGRTLATNGFELLFGIFEIAVMNDSILMPLPANAHVGGGVPS